MPANAWPRRAHTFLIVLVFIGNCTKMLINWVPIAKSIWNMKAKRHSVSATVRVASHVGWRFMIFVSPALSLSLSLYLAHSSIFCFFIVYDTTRSCCCCCCRCPFCGQTKNFRIENQFTKLYHTMHSYFYHENRHWNDNIANEWNEGNVWTRSNENDIHSNQIWM